LKKNENPTPASQLEAQAKSPHQPKALSSSTKEKRRKGKKEKRKRGMTEDIARWIAIARGLLLSAP
jgi:hypothetical protein